jgi:DNA modification methylase
MLLVLRKVGRNGVRNRDFTLNSSESETDMASQLKSARQGTTEERDVKRDIFSALAEAALDRTPVSGWTHNFYRYPARFSPRFAATAIECFSQPNDLVLDPYMGGGTAIVESIVSGRNVIGNDLNSLASFVAKVKVTLLSLDEMICIKRWATREVPSFGYHYPSEDLLDFIDADKIKNMSLARARFIKKAVAAALSSILDLPTENARNFARCALLRVGQWALDGRERHTPLSDFRSKLTLTTEEMLESIKKFGERARENGAHATILNMNASLLNKASIFQNGGRKAALAVTSPPYPGVHVLYHRWQVDGRRETPAPYWIAGCNDGRGASFYNFGDRREAAADTYFTNSLITLQAIRCVIRDGGHMVQMLAFNRPDEQLPRYLENMERAGFAEARIKESRIWREVPHRKWHASLTGKTHSSNEVVLVHQAI